MLNSTGVPVCSEGQRVSHRGEGQLSLQTAIDEAEVISREIGQLNDRRTLLDRVDALDEALSILDGAAFVTAELRPVRGMCLSLPLRDAPAMLRMLAAA